MGKKLRRGFKAEAERISLGLRNEMGLNKYSPLDAFELSKHLGISIYTPQELGLEEELIKILTGPSSGWSAFTLINKRGKKVIVHNDKHHIHRQQSNIMHELSHIICKHATDAESGNYSNYTLPTYMREYNEDQESEATYLGSCLQLPRECLLWAIGSQGMNKKQISNHFFASVDMVTFRINSTGIKYQLKYATIR